MSMVNGIFLEVYFLMFTSIIWSFLRRWKKAAWNANAYLCFGKQCVRSLSSGKPTHEPDRLKEILFTNPIVAALSIVFVVVSFSFIRVVSFCCRAIVFFCRSFEAFLLCLFYKSQEEKCLSCKNPNALGSAKEKNKLNRCMNCDRLYLIIINYNFEE